MSKADGPLDSLLLHTLSASRVDFLVRYNVRQSSVLRLISAHVGAVEAECDRPSRGRPVPGDLLRGSRGRRTLQKSLSPRSPLSTIRLSSLPPELRLNRVGRPLISAISLPRLPSIHPHEGPAPQKIGSLFISSFLTPLSP